MQSGQCQSRILFVRCTIQGKGCRSSLEKGELFFSFMFQGQLKTGTGTVQRASRQSGEVFPVLHFGQ